MKLPMKFKLKELQVEIIGFCGSPGVGYIRFEKDGEYVGSIDCQESKIKLMKLRKAIDQMIKGKE